MLLVPVWVDRSVIHGHGVFVLDPIPKGAVAWRFAPGFDLELDPALLEQQPAHFQRVMRHYGYVEPVRAATSCVVTMRAINHSERPNLGTDRKAGPFGVDVALRDIEAGEELILDYGGVEGFRPVPA